MEKRKKIQKLNDFKQQYRDEAARLDSLVTGDGTRILSSTEQYLLNEISRLEKELYGKARF